MAALRDLYAGLKLRINESKSAVARPWDRKFLGYSFLLTKKSEVKRCVAPKALAAMKERVRRLTSRVGGRSIERVIEGLREYLTGWKAYFRLAQTPTVLKRIDEWIRHRLRSIQLKQWKRGTTIYRELIARGLTHRAAAKVAGNARSWWKNSAMAINVALPNKLYAAVPQLGG